MKLRFDDFDTYRSAALGLGMEFVQLDKGSFTGFLQQVSHRNVQLSHFSFNRHFHQRGTVAGFGRTFGLLFAADSPMSWHNQPFNGDCLAVFPADGSFDAVSHPGFDAVSVAIRQEFLEDVATVHDMHNAIDLIPQTAAVFRLSTKIGRRLRAAVTHYLRSDPIVHGSDHAAQLETEMSRLILNVFNDGRSQTSVPAPRKRDQALARAVELINQTASPLSVDELCRSVGASERTLRYAFQENFGVAPKQYLNAHRLRQVRSQLLGAHPDQLVQDIAASFGFWHTGQFAADYRQTFGEYPSETLSRN